MLLQKIITVKQGIWIDESWLEKAGLGSSLQLLVKQGEIRIITAEESETEDAEAGWEVFLSLGKDGTVSKFTDADTNHDRYLYGKEEGLKSLLQT